MSNTAILKTTATWYLRLFFSDFWIVPEPKRMNVLKFWTVVPILLGDYWRGRGSNKKNKKTNLLLISLRWRWYFSGSQAIYGNFPKLLKILSELYECPKYLSIHTYAGWKYRNSKTLNKYLLHIYWLSIFIVCIFYLLF